MTTINIFKHAAQTETFEAGQTIVHEGETGSLMYAIQQGEVDIFIEGVYIETLGPSSIVGEMGLLDQQPRCATGIARTRCVLVPIDRQRFSFLVQQTPYFALHVMQIIAERLRQAHSRYMEQVG